MDEILAGEEPEGLFSKRSSGNNILSDPKILEHLRIISENASRTSDQDEERVDDDEDIEMDRKELAEKILNYNKRSQFGAFRIVQKEALGYEGALRFYFEDGQDKQTKAVKLTNTTTVEELLPNLIEKFKPDLVYRNVATKAKLYQVYELEEAVNNESSGVEICLDPSDCPLDIVLNAKSNPRFVCRIEVISSKNGEAVQPPEPISNGSANHSNEPETPVSPSTLSLSSGSTSPISSQASSPAPSPSHHKSGLMLNLEKGTQPSSHKSHQPKILQKNGPLRKSLSKISFRKRSVGEMLKIKKRSDKSAVELSTNQNAPGVLKVFGDHVSPGSNYKSVRATTITPADEIVKQALERYSLEDKDHRDYVLCDVVGHFEKAEPSPDDETPQSPRQMEKWVTEYVRVIDSKEVPLVLQSLWKPASGRARRFELRKKDHEVEGHVGGCEVLLDGRRSISSAHSSEMGSIELNNSKGKKLSNALSDSSIFNRTARKSTNSYPDSARHSMIIGSSLLAPVDTPFLTLIKGYNALEDFLIHRLDDHNVVVGRVVEEVEDDYHKPEIILLAPDILAHHCWLTKQVITCDSVDADENGITFATFLEPHPGASVSINNLPVNTGVQLNPGDLITLGQHYMFLYKDPTWTNDSSLQLQWLVAMQNDQYDLEERTKLRLRKSSTMRVSDVGVQCQILPGENANTEVSFLRMSFPYEISDEDSLLDTIVSIVDLESTQFKITPAYLLLMVLENASRYHSEKETRHLMLKISTAIQSVASEKTSEISSLTTDKPTDPILGMRELVPYLKPVIFWMANALELLHFLQNNMASFLNGDVYSDPLDPDNDEALLAADEELLTVLEEVILYTFQQTVYHLTKVLYVALPVVLDTNPFQKFDDDDDDSDTESTEKKPQGVDIIILIFQETYNLVGAYSIHQHIVRQLFAYLFFFTNASLFNTLMERGAGGKFYRWAKGAQIRGNLDILDNWVSQYNLQEEASHYLKTLSTAADLLATPKVQLLQADWMSIRRDFPALNAAQVQQILGEYQLGQGKSRPRGWFPPPEEVEPALRSADILESFTDHPPLLLPTTEFLLDMETMPSDLSFQAYLQDLRKEFAEPAKGRPLKKSSNIPEKSQSATGNPVPVVIVSQAASAEPPSPGAHTPKPFISRSETQSSHSNPSGSDDERQKKMVRRATEPNPAMKLTSTPIDRNSPEVPPDLPVVINNKPPKGNIIPKHTTPMKAVPEERVAISDPSVHHNSRTRPGHANQGSPPVSSSEASPANSRPSSASSSIASSQSSSRNPRQQVVVEEGRWMDVKNNNRNNLLEGLSVSAVNLNASSPGRMRAVPESPVRSLTNGVHEGGQKDPQQFGMGLSRNKSQSTGALDGWREKDDGEDDVFIVELEKGDNGIGLGLIDGLHTPLRSPGIYVRTLVPDGPAIQDGRLRLGDRILAVNGTSLVGADYQSAMDQIRNAGGHLSFLVAKSDKNVAMKITASSC